MTTQEASSITQSASRCTEAVLTAYGIKDKIPRTGSGCLEYLTTRGFKLTPLKEGIGLSLRCWYSNCDLTKDYLIVTPGHVLAITQGIVVDTCPKPKATVTHAWLVEKGIE